PARSSPRRRPRSAIKSAPLQPLREQAGALPVVPDHLQQISSPPSEAEQVAAQGIAAQHFLDLQRQRRKALAHIRVARRQPHANARRQRDHRCRSALITRASTAVSTSLPAINPQPPGSSVAIRPAIDNITACAGTGACAITWLAIPAGTNP